MRLSMVFLTHSFDIFISPLHIVIYSYYSLATAYLLSSQISTFVMESLFERAKNGMDNNPFVIGRLERRTEAKRH